MEKDNNWVNKRAHPRIAWTFIVRFRPHKSEGPREWGVSFINDISLGGCYFYSNIPFEVGEVLDIEIQFPILTEPMKFIGEVKRCEHNEDIKVSTYGIAIQFLEMDTNKKDKFIGTVTYFLKKHSKTKG